MSEAELSLSIIGKSKLCVAKALKALEESRVFDDFIITGVKQGNRGDYIGFAFFKLKEDGK